MGRDNTNNSIENNDIHSYLIILFMQEIVRLNFTNNSVVLYGETVID
jgi:hypothetical protein